MGLLGRRARRIAVEGEVMRLTGVDGVVDAPRTISIGCFQKSRRSRAHIGMATMDIIVNGYYVSDFQFDIFPVCSTRREPGIVSSNIHTAMTVTTRCWSVQLTINALLLIELDIIPNFHFPIKISFALCSIIDIVM